MVNEEVERIKEKISKGQPISIEENRIIQEAQRPTTTIAKRRELQREKFQAPRQARATKSKIIVDQKGKQVAAIVTREGGTQADITRITPTGQTVKRTVRGIPEFVQQETQKVEKEYPKIITKSLRIERVKKAQGRINDIEKQLQSGLVRQDKEQELLNEREKLIKESNKLLTAPKRVIKENPKLDNEKYKQIFEKSEKQKVQKKKITSFDFSKVETQLSGSQRVIPFPGEKVKDIPKVKTQLKKNDPGFFTRAGQMLAIKRSIEVGTRPIINLFETPERLIKGGPLVPKSTVTANIKPGMTKNTLEFVANNPFETAFILTGAGKVAKTGYTLTTKAATKLSGQQALKFLSSKTASKALTPVINKQITRSITNQATKTLFAPTTLPNIFGRGASTLASSAAITQGTISTGRITATKEQKDVIKKIEESGLRSKDLVIKALAQEEEGIANINGGIEKLGVFGKKRDVSLFGKQLTLDPRIIARSLPGGTLIKFGKEQKLFENSIRSQLQDLNLSEKEIEQAVKYSKRQKGFRAGAELASALNIERGTEAVGRQLILRGATKKIGTIRKGLFGFAAPRIALAGVFEGAGGEALQAQSRGEKITSKRLISGGLFGGAFAGTIGGTIASTSVRKPVTSKVLNIFANIADPLEKPGDILQDVFERTGSRITGKPRLGATFKKVGDEIELGIGVIPKKQKFRSPVDIIQETQKQQSKKSESTFNDLINKFDPGFKNRPATFIPEPGKPTPTDSKRSIFKFDKPKNNIKPKIKEFGFSILPFTDTPTETPTEIKEKSKRTPTPTTTPTPTNTPSQIPVVTPLGRIFPPVPFGFGGAGSGLAGRSRSKGFLFGELGAGLAAFGLGQKLTKQIIKSRKKVAKRKGKKKSVVTKHKGKKKSVKRKK